MPENATRKNLRDTILEQAVQLFAQSGYDGVSMRAIASSVGVTVAALYYYFPDKEQLYLDAIARAFEGKTSPLTIALTNPEPPWMRLEAFIGTATRLCAEEKDFLRLMQWVLLDNNEQRANKLVTNVFQKLFAAISKFATKLGGGYDANLLASSIIALIFFPFISENTNRFLPNYPDHSKDTMVLEQHIFRLLCNGLVGGGRR